MVSEIEAQRQAFEKAQQQLQSQQFVQSKPTAMQIATMPLLAKQQIYALQKSSFEQAKSSALTGLEAQRQEFEKEAKAYQDVVNEQEYWDRMYKIGVEYQARPQDWPSLPREAQEIAKSIFYGEAAKGSSIGVYGPTGKMYFASDIPTMSPEVTKYFTSAGVLTPSTTTQPTQTTTPTITPLIPSTSISQTGGVYINPLTGEGMSIKPGGTIPAGYYYNTIATYFPQVYQTYQPTAQIPTTPTPMYTGVNIPQITVPRGQSVQTPFGGIQYGPRGTIEEIYVGGRPTFSTIGTIGTMVVEELQKKPRAIQQIIETAPKRIAEMGGKSFGYVAGKLTPKEGTTTTIVVSREGYYPRGTAQLNMATGQFETPKEEKKIYRTREEIIKEAQRFGYTTTALGEIGVGTLVSPWIGYGIGSPFFKPYIEKVRKEGAPPVAAAAEFLPTSPTETAEAWLGLKLLGKLGRVGAIGITGLGGLQYVQAGKAAKEVGITGKELEREISKEKWMGGLTTGLGILGLSGEIIPRVSGSIRSIGRKEVPAEKLIPPKAISGEETFPQAPTKEHLRLFQEFSQRLPGQRPEVEISKLRQDYAKYNLYTQLKYGPESKYPLGHAYPHAEAVARNINKLIDAYPELHPYFIQKYGSVAEAKSQMTQAMWHDLTKIGSSSKSEMLGTHGETFYELWKQGKLPNDIQINKEIAKAIKVHEQTFGAKTPEAKILATADRLDLTRFGIKVDRNKLPLKDAIERIESVPEQEIPKLDFTPEMEEFRTQFLKDYGISYSTGEIAPKPTAPGQMFHATGKIFWKGGLTEIGPSSSEIPGLYGSYGVSPAFLKIGGSKSSTGKFNLLDVFKRGLSPGVLAITPSKGFEVRKPIRVESYKLGEKEFNLKFPGKLEAGKAYVPTIKTEVEAVLPTTIEVPGQALKLKSREFFFKYPTTTGSIVLDLFLGKGRYGIKVPIDTALAIGKKEVPAKISKVKGKEIKGEVKSSYRGLPREVPSLIVPKSPSISKKESIKREFFSPSKSSGKSSLSISITPQESNLYTDLSRPSLTPREFFPSSVPSSIPRSSITPTSQRQPTSTTYFYPTPTKPEIPPPPSYPKKYPRPISKTKPKRVSPKGYYVLTKKRGKPFLITPKPLSKAQALGFGVAYTKRTERATFKLVPTTRAPTTISGVKPMTETEVFKLGYRPPIKKGKVQPVTNIFIQKAPTRLGTRQEVIAVQKYKRSKSIW